MAKRQAIVSFVAFACLAIAFCTLLAEFCFVAQGRHEPPSTLFYRPAAPDFVLAAGAGDVDLDFSPDGCFLAAVEAKDSSGAQGTVRVFRIADRQTVATLGHGADSCAWSPDGSLLAVALDQPPRLELWNTKTWTRSDKIDVPPPYGSDARAPVIFGSLCFDQLGNVYVVHRIEGAPPNHTQSRALAWWNPPGGRSKRLEAIGSYPNREAFSLSASGGTESETRLAISYVCKEHASDGSDAPFEVLSIRHNAGRERTIRQEHTLLLTHEAWIRMRPDGRMLAAISGTNLYTSGLFEITSQDLTGSWPPGPSGGPWDAAQMRFRRVDFSDNNRLVAFVRPGSEDAACAPQVCEFGTGRVLLYLDYSTAVSLSSDGHLVAVSSPRRGILIYSVPSASD
jgi:hypothetical protein